MQVEKRQWRASLLIMPPRKSVPTLSGLSLSTLGEALVVGFARKVSALSYLEATTLQSGEDCMQVAEKRAAR